MTIFNSSATSNSMLQLTLLTPCQGLLHVLTMNTLGVVF